MTWETGDVAMVTWWPSKDRPSVERLAMRMPDGDWGIPGVTTLGGDSLARPLVVIDPRDDEQADRLFDLISEHEHEVTSRRPLPNGWARIALRAALRGFAGPTPEPCVTCADQTVVGFTCNTCGNGAA